jgi:hypothetical protein
MALHRDIFWIGRQWAVTGFGMQAINQKLGGEFDIAVERLWDDDWLFILSAQKWFNADDFNKGLAIARARYPRPPGKPAPPPLPVETLLQASATIATPEAPASPITAAVAPPPIVAAEAAQEPVKPEEPAPSFPQLSISGHPARLLRIWRVRRRP